MSVTTPGRGTRPAASAARRTPLHTPLRTQVTIDSPVGPLILVAQDGALAALYMTEHRHAPAPETLGAPGDPALAPFAAAAAQLAAYFAGELTRFDLPLRPSGTPFQERVWAELREIPFGETATYGELAGRIGAPGSSRAVGLANGKNPISIIIPCHRVIGSDGSLTGYGGGLDRKRFLLDLERRAAGAPGQLPLG